MKYVQILIVIITFFLFSYTGLGGCAAGPLQPGASQPAILGYKTSVYDDLISLPPAREKIVVAVYKFRDQTGQYKTTASGQTWSTAVTQGATSMLIKALQDSRWFVAVEREGLSDLLNERKIVQATRQRYASENQQQPVPLPPLLFAGIIIEGGIVSYETNVVTGGTGARYFGIGSNVQIQKDQVTVYLRAVSTKTGQILKTVHATKTILSKLISANFYRFVRFKRLLEMETGLTTNEPPQMCVREAIEKAVLLLIAEGIADGMWQLKNPVDTNAAILKSVIEESRKGIDYNETLIGEKPVKEFGVSVSIGAQIPGHTIPHTFEPAARMGIYYFLNKYLSYAFLFKAGQFKTTGSVVTRTASMGAVTRIALFPENSFSPYAHTGMAAVNSWPVNTLDYALKRKKRYWAGFEPSLINGGGICLKINDSYSVHALAEHQCTFTDDLDAVHNGKERDSFWTFAVGGIFHVSLKNRFSSTNVENEK